MIDSELADFLRYVYAGLAMLACGGFVMSLVIRWDILYPGERVLRAGLVLEHAVITYAAYTALKLDYPPTEVGAMLVASLLIVVFGFVLWFGDLLLNRRRDLRRLTDPPSPSS